MTNEEGISIIKIALAQVEWEYPMDYATALDMAIEALEKQIRIKPILYNGNPYSPYDDCAKDVYVCACGNRIEPTCQHCENCGQAIDWSADMRDNTDGK